MQIGDRVQVFDTKHPFYTFRGTIIGFRGKKPPDDTWVLIFIDNRGRSYLIPQSMIRVISSQGGEGHLIDPWH